MHMLEKNDQKLDNFLFQKDFLASKNIQEDKSSNPIFNKKLEKIYQNLDSNLNTTFPVFSTSKNTFDIKLDKSSSLDRKFDFTNVVNYQDYNFNKMSRDNSRLSDLKNDFNKTQCSGDKLFTNVNTPTNDSRNASSKSNVNSNDKIHIGTSDVQGGFNNNKFC